MGDTPAKIWLPPLLLLLIALISVPTALLEEEGVQRYERLKVEAAEVQKQNDTLVREIEGLQIQVEELRSDPKTIESVARETHGLSGTDESTLQF